MRDYSAASQSLDMEGIGNARELGGYRTQDGQTIRRGLLLRTAAPDNASTEDCHKLKDELRLSCVLDLRMDMELQTLSGSAYALGFATRHHVSILDENYYMELYGQTGIPLEELMKMPFMQMVVTAVDLGAINDAMYVDFLEAPAGRRAFGKVFGHLLAQPAGEALLFHCTQGKDRTGLVAMLILEALGVDEETILFDYLLTNTFNADLIRREQQGLLAMGIDEERHDKYMLGFDKVFEPLMRKAMDHLEQAYGSVWGYIHDELGVSESDRAELCAKYLS